MALGLGNVEAAQARTAGIMNGPINGRQAAEWIWRAITVLLIPMLAYLGLSIQQLNTTIQALDRRVVGIEASRFTTQDGFDMWQEFDRRLDEIERNGQ